MTSYALLHIARELDRMAACPDGIWADEVRALAKFARSEAGVDDAAVSAAGALRPLSIRGLHVGDVLARRWADESIPEYDNLYMVVKTLRKQRKVNVVAPDGTPFTFPLCDFTHKVPQEVVASLRLQWRWNPALR